MHRVIPAPSARAATWRVARRPPASRGPTAIMSAPPDAATRCASLRVKTAWSAPMGTGERAVIRASASVEAAGVGCSTYSTSCAIDLAQHPQRHLDGPGLVGVEPQAGLRRGGSHGGHGGEVPRLAHRRP